MAKKLKHVGQYQQRGGN